MSQIVEAARLVELACAKYGMPIEDVTYVTMHCPRRGLSVQLVNAHAWPEVEMRERFGNVERQGWDGKIQNWESAKIPLWVARGEIDGQEITFMVRAEKPAVAEVEA